MLPIEGLQKEMLNFVALECPPLMPSLRRALREYSSTADLEDILRSELQNLTAFSGAEIAAIISEREMWSLDAPLVRVAAPDTPVPYSPPLEYAFCPAQNTLSLQPFS